MYRAIRDTIAVLHANLLESAGDLVATEWAKLDERERRIWEIIDNWVERDKNKELQPVIGNKTRARKIDKDSGWSKGDPVVLAKLDKIDSVGITGLFGQLDRITAQRIDLLKLMSPEPDALSKEHSDPMVLVVVNNRDQISPIMDATAFHQVLAHAPVSQ